MQLLSSSSSAAALLRSCHQHQQHLKPRGHMLVPHAAGSNWQGGGGGAGNRVEQWLQTPFDVASFGPRAALGALLSLPERLQTLPMDVQRVSELVQDPRPVEEKQAVVLQEVEDALVTFLERGATIESDIRANLSTLLPPDVVQQLDALIPPPPNSPLQQQQRQPWQGATTNQYQQQYGADGTPTNEPPVTYTADSVLESQIASEMTEVRGAVSGLKAALEELQANSDAARASMLRLNLREARDVLARRLQETAPGVAPVGASSDAALAAATREAAVLLDEVDAAFFGGSSAQQ